MRINSNKELAKKLHKPIIRKFKKRKTQSSFKDSIQGADLTNMKLIRQFNKGIRSVLLIFSANTHWLLKDIKINNGVPKMLIESNRKPKKRTWR